MVGIRINKMIMEMKDFRIGTFYIESQRYPFDRSFRGKIKLTENDLRDIFNYRWQKAYKEA